MAKDDIIIDNAKYRVLTDEKKSIWSRISFWKAAQDVECADGNNLEDRVYAEISKIDGTQLKYLTAENGAIFQFDIVNGEYGFWAYGVFYPFGGLKPGTVIAEGDEDITFPIPAKGKYEYLLDGARGGKGNCRFSENRRPPTYGDVAISNVMHNKGDMVSIIVGQTGGDARYPSTSKAKGGTGFNDGGNGEHKGEYLGGGGGGSTGACIVGTTNAIAEAKGGDGGSANSPGAFTAHGGAGGGTNITTKVETSKRTKGYYKVTYLGKS